MKYLIYIPLILIIPFLYSCEEKTEYERLVQTELDRGVRYDALFLGYELGMEREDFLDHSWQLNQQGIITGGVQVVYKLEDLSHNATMVFYPHFHNDRIYRMPVQISFDAWAPWNRHLFSDSLITELVEHYEEIYDPGFIKTIHPEVGREAWIKVDGNRRISIFRKDDMTARIEFIDLTVDIDQLSYRQGF